jgi:hypothetical protein
VNSWPDELGAAPTPVREYSVNIPTPIQEDQLCVTAFSLKINTVSSNVLLALSMTYERQHDGEYGAK